MSGPVPQSKAEELLSDFVDWNKAIPAPNVNSIELQRFKKRAREQIPFDPAIAHSVLGAIASIQFKEAEMREHHEASLRWLDVGDLRGNYAISLQRCGFLQEAGKIMTDCFRHEPENLDYLEQAIKITWLAGCVDEALSLCDEYRKRTQKHHDSRDEISSVKRILASRGVSELVFAEGIAIANSVAFEREIFSPTVHVIVDTDAGDESVLYVSTVLTDSDTVESMQSELAQRLFESLGDRWRPEVTLFEYEAVNAD